MLRVNKKMEYGIIALLYLDRKADKVASVREISEACGVPVTLLSKIMQSLKAHDWVSAVYGNHGGYRLNQNLNSISLLDLNRTLVGPVAVTACLENTGKHDCPAHGHCSILEPMSILNQKLVDLFQSTSIATLANRKVAL